MTRAGITYSYNFLQNRIPGTAADEEQAYWKDVGTLGAFYDANMDLKNVAPRLNLFNWKWPILTVNYNDPPAKFVFDEAGRRGQALQSIVSAGCILAGGRAKDSVLGRNVFLDSESEVYNSILMENVHVGPRARIRRAIIDKNVRIAADQHVGFDLEADRQRYYVSDNGIVIIPKAPETPETRERDL